MIRQLTWLAVAILGTSCSSFALAVPLDSSLFTHQYNGDYPVAGYTENGPFAAGPSSAAGILSYQSTIDSALGYWVTDPWAASGASGWTIETRVKIGAGAEGTQGSFLFFMSDGTSGYRIFYIGQDRFYTQGQLPWNTDSNTDDYHVFRIAKAAGDDEFLAWRDGVPVGSVTGWGGSAFGSDDFLYWGDGGGAAGGPTIEVDYFRFDITGAYEPVPIPEPTSNILLLIGATTLLAKSRRKGLRARN